MSPLSNLQLGEIDLTLIPRDRKILSAMRNLKFIRTNQAMRLFFPPVGKTERAALTFTTKNLNRLKKLGLVSHLDKHIGGIRTGSFGLVWYVTNAGCRLLDLNAGIESSRINKPELSSVTLRHKLAVTETYVQIVEICRTEETMKLAYLSVEPGCWRSYEVKGKPISLRPDLYAETISGKYEDHWFIEMDLDTEAMSVVIDKCGRYYDYYLTNKEQRVGKVFPVVLWVVPSESRKQKMIEAIKNSFGKRQSHLFLVITPAEFAATLKNGVEEEQLC